MDWWVRVGTLGPSVLVVELKIDVIRILFGGASPCRAVTTVENAVVWWTVDHALFLIYSERVRLQSFPELLI